MILSKTAEQNQMDTRIKKYIKQVISLYSQSMGYIDSYTSLQVFLLNM